MLHEQTITFDDDVAFVSLRRGVHWLPFLSESGDRVLGAVSSDSRLLAEYVVASESEAIELREQCWRILNTLDPQSSEDDSTRCKAALRGA
jgi:hypothetical protein